MVEQVWAKDGDMARSMYTDDRGRDYDLRKMVALWDAVDDEAVTTFTLDSSLTPKEQLHKIIEWHVQVATDPAVNGGYKLVRVRDIIRHCIIATARYMHYKLTGQPYDKPWKWAKEDQLLMEKIEEDIREGVEP